MHYEDLVEFSVKEWDGKPFGAIVEDKEDIPMEEEDLERLCGTREPLQVVGYMNGAWVDSRGCDWAHAYRLEDNKGVHVVMRMTYRQLAMWLSKGKGEFINKHNGVSIAICYDKGKESQRVEDSIKVRKWGSNEWIEPTTDLLEEN